MTESHGENAESITYHWCRTRVINSLVDGTMWYYLTTSLVIVAAVLGVERLQLCTDHFASKSRFDLISGLAAWDGQWYSKIASCGYDVDPHDISSVVFFPAYPALAAGLRRVTGMRTEWALLAVSHGALWGAFVLMHAYVRRRFPVRTRKEMANYVLLAMGLFPTTLWMRMAYTESLFLFVVLLAMWGMECGWSPWIVAAVIGFATATRPVGVALVPVFWLWLWQRSATWRRAVVSAIGLLPVTLWGLLAYMAFLHYEFGEPLAFANSQVHFDKRNVSFGEKIFKLASFEPFWSVYVPSSECYWGRVSPRDNPLFNPRFANPVYMLFTIGLIGVGAWRRWLSPREILLAICLLAMPMWFQACRACMISQARYASVVFPFYLVAGNLLYRMPAPFAAFLAAICGSILVIYTAMFVSWFYFY